MITGADYRLWTIYFSKLAQ